ncbi:MAG: hypothetical protein R3255_09310 [Candidatus Lokiarchaeia archaeon]|nr:hypothetical protein [Candidatus Lokiarchaeia archaeon]
MKPSLREVIIIYGAGLIITIISILFFAIRGYPFVITATEILTILTPPIYMIPVFLPFGILIGEIIWLWNEKKDHIFYILLIFECFIVAFFSFIRYAIILPLSGHAIILFFYIFHQAINNKLKHPLRFLIGIVVLTITIIYKIFIWNDPITFLLGALLGIVLWLPGGIYRLKFTKNDN